MKLDLNVANWDRGARVALGLAGVGIAVAGISPWGWLGLILVATGTLGWCPIYWALRIRTKKA
jgi:hypothetical protein